jgi:hypothetical protein
MALARATGALNQVPCDYFVVRKTLINGRRDFMLSPNYCEALQFGAVCNRGCRRHVPMFHRRFLTTASTVVSAAGRVFPVALLTSMLGGFFIETLGGVNFPSSLPTFDGGYEFLQPLLGVSFEAFLETSMFVGFFIEPLEGVDFRASLLAWLWM